MQRLVQVCVIFLSLIALSNIASALIIEEYGSNTDNSNLVIESSSGDNINVALVKQYIADLKQDLLDEAMVLADDRINSFNNKFDETVSLFSFKLGLGFVTLCLFMFNIYLGRILLIEVVFKNG